MPMSQMAQVSLFLPAKIIETGDSKPESPGLVLRNYLHIHERAEKLVDKYKC